MKKNFLLEAENTWAQGQNLNLLAHDATESKVLMMHFLRHYRSADASQIVHDQETLEQKLEVIRTQIRSSNYEVAATNIQFVLSSRHQHCELTIEFLLEQLRIEIFRKNYLQALEVSAQILSQSVLSKLSRLTVLQLRADAYYHLGEYSSAQETFAIALPLAEQYPMAASAFATYAFYALLCAELEDTKQLQMAFTQMQLMLSKITSIEMWTDRLLIYLRTQFRTAQLSRDQKNMSKYWKQCWILAKVINHHHILLKCDADRILLAESISNDELLQTKYLWLPDIQVLLFLNDLKKVNLSKKTVLAKIIDALTISHLSSSELFEKIWQMSYVKYKHDNLLRVQVSNLRKLLPDGVLNNQGGLWKLVD